MATRLGLVIVASLLAVTPSAHATCGWFGTQLDCGLGAGQIVFGTQASQEPAYATSMRPSGFQYHRRLLDRSPAATPFRLELQNIGSDRTLCRRFGNECYCH